MMTFKELKKLVKLPLYKEQRVPTVKALEESGVSVVAEKILENHGSISVYQNGYVIYRAHKRVTVFSLRNCVHYKYDALEGAGHHIEEEEFEEYEWHIRLVLEGEDRIFMNYEIIQGKWMPSREDREYREEILEGVDEAVSTLERMISEERVEELLSTLTDLQRKVVHTHLFHGLSFTEAAKHLGMTRQNLTGIYNAAMETYTYQEEVEYEYKILNVLLKNKGFDTIARKNMDRKQTGRYDAYNLTYGNRPELFGAGSPTYSGGTTGSIGSGSSGGTGGSSGGGFRYDIPEEALSDEKFARMIAEAEKYLGMPYVWGGSSPSTSFDCSGFVCWVINNCGNGWNVGRTTANGLRGKCSYVSPANAQPGDLIFFEKTYNTVGASHVGIYVGNGMMIHCGDPISYTSINSTYWQNHFLGFGRIK